MPQTDLGKADYTLIQDFDDLAAALRTFAVALCKASVSVTKLVDEGDGIYRPDPGWNVTATVSTSPGSYSWVTPPTNPTTPGPRTQVTDDDGVATFQWKPDEPTATSTVSVQEESRPGYEPVDWFCEKNAPGRTKKVTTERNRATPRDGHARAERVRPVHAPEPDPARHDRDREAGDARDGSGVQLHRIGATRDLLADR